MLYSKNENGFFHPDRHAHNMPTDVVPISDVHYAEIIDALQNGAQLSADSAGNPVAVFPAAPSAAEILEQVKAELRPLRDAILTKVVDIGAAAVATGDDALRDEVFLAPNGVRRKLLDITDDPSLNAATTREEMEEAVLAYYASIVSSVSPELRGAFKELEK